MCGIAGIVSLTNDRISEQSLTSLNNCLAHRGPDSSGIWVSSNGGIGLAHKRLSIIDLDRRADQPMADKEEEIRITFNGEIYNFAEIRKELAKEYELRTSSDTEVVIYAYRKWGLDGALERFRGFFAFALYDEQRKTLFLVRDRFGKKPLYYFRTDRFIAFASEAHSFGTIVRLKVQDSSLYHYLTLGCTIPPDTFFEGIQKVVAGSYIQFSLNDRSLSHHVYYDVATKLSHPNRMRRSVDELEAIQVEATRLRMVSDVPVALSLSGGLDSSLNAYFCRKNKPLCITFSWDGFNPHAEQDLAKKVAEEFALPFKEIRLNAHEFMKDVTEYVRFQKDAPVGDINAVLIYIMSRQIRELGYKVCVVGEGGDEIGGYPTYRNLFRNARLVRSLGPDILRLLGRLSARFSRLMDYSHNGEVLPFHILLGFLESEKRKFWRKEAFDTRESVSDLMKQVEAGFGPFDRYLRKVTNLEYKLRLPELILARIDYPSMAASVEMRSPYMDHVLIEAYNDMPWEERINGTTTKKQFREIASRYLAPEVLAHPKVGFTHVLDSFMKDTLPGLFRADVVKKESPLKEYIDPGYLSWAADNLRNENLWRLYSLNAWLEQHL